MLVRAPQTAIVARFRAIGSAEGVFRDWHRGLSARGARIMTEAKPTSLAGEEQAIIYSVRTIEPDQRMLGESRKLVAAEYTATTSVMLTTLRLAALGHAWRLTTEAR